MKLMHNVCFQKISIPTPIEEGLLENPRGRRDIQGPKSKKESVGGVVQVQTIEPPVGEVWIFFGTFNQRNCNTNLHGS